MGAEKDKHEVTLDRFKMAQYQTTFWQYGLFAIQNDVNLKDKEPSWGIEGNNPVVTVSWYNAVEFANWLSRKQGLTAGNWGCEMALSVFKLRSRKK